MIKFQKKITMDTHVHKRNCKGVNEILPFSSNIEEYFGIVSSHPAFVYFILDITLLIIGAETLRPYKINILPSKDSNSDWPLSTLVKYIPKYANDITKVHDVN